MALILELIKQLHDELNSAVILITHDLGVVAETCDRVLVMYGGKCVETGPVDEMFYAPEMPYTCGLLRSRPRMDRDRQTRLTPIPGSPPSLIDVPSGCVFNIRCSFTDRVDCDTAAPCIRISSRERRAAMRCGATSRPYNARRSGLPRFRRISSPAQRAHLRFTQREPSQ